MNDTKPEPQPDQVTIELIACLKDGTITEPHTHGTPWPGFTDLPDHSELVKVHQQLDEAYAHLTQTTLETQRLAARYAHGYQED